MYRIQGESFAKQVGGEGKHGKLSIWPVRLIGGFRSIFMCLFSFSSSRKPPAAPQRWTNDRIELPKTSCSSSRYSVDSHYDEAISDCIEFFNKSSQDTRLSVHKIDDFV
ncbi:hypothetical protein IHE45_01G075000 [Dioscorea alata]|uniref:Uncharacterized protein n=1 Tax=Dioscorea alata TaxID=55571 RepID=A0ACB7WUT3_DIOAL|nr:hypothetical protein IHE45_01G075000 [Dioscorea alata]